MSKVIQRFRCLGCDNEEAVTMSDKKASMYEATVICGGCGREMVMVSEEPEEDDGTEDGVPYGPITFLDL